MPLLGWSAFMAAGGTTTGGKGMKELSTAIRSVIVP